MDFEEFMKKVVESLEENCKEGEEIRVHETQKNNDIIMHGLNKIREDQCMSANVYLEEMYEEYKEGTPLIVILMKIEDIFDHDNVARREDFENIKDFEKVKENIVYKLINYEKNEKNLETIPHRRFENLAIAYYIKADAIIEDATITISNKILEYWNRTEEDLYEAAKENSPIKNEYDYFEMNGLNVLTNKKKQHGAATILYKDVLKNIRDELDKDIYILPSSIHEVLLFPVDEFSDEEARTLREVVRDVNRKEVSEEDFLSDEIYYYDENADLVRLVEID